MSGYWNDTKSGWISRRVIFVMQALKKKAKGEDSG